MEISSNNEGSSKGDTIYCGTGSCTFSSNKFTASASFGRTIKYGIVTAQMTTVMSRSPAIAVYSGTIVNASSFSANMIYIAPSPAAGSYMMNVGNYCVWIGAAA